jgi:predicted protein tyrosine phosphatase
MSEDGTVGTDAGACRSPATALVAHSAANDQEGIELLPELDALVPENSPGEGGNVLDGLGSRRALPRISC